MRSLTFLAVSGALGLGFFGACEKYDTCENALSCDEYATGGTSGDGDTGGSGDGDGDVTGGQGGDGGETGNPCDACGGDEPACKDGTTCVECTEEETSACTGDEDICDPGTNLCVECLLDSDCGGDTPLCGDDGLCAACVDAPSCGDLGNHCLPSGACVECTVETDDRTVDTDDCGTGVCNPETLECEVGLTQMGKDTCESCIADNECEADHNCVPMEFKGELRLGGYCLRTLASGSCSANPYRTPTPARPSLSESNAQVYCGLNEAFATCEAYLDLDADKDCGSAEDCGAPGVDDGLCETVTTVAGKCTYECTGVAQCPTDDPGSGCDGDAAGNAASFCGGM